MAAGRRFTEAGREGEVQITTAATGQTSTIRVNPDSWWFKYLLSCFAATMAEFVTYPLDLMKTRLQVQGEYGFQSGGSSAVVRKGMLKVASGIVREEGLFKLWHGMTPAIYRHAVYTGCRMAVYEKMRDNVLGRNPDGSFPLWKAVIGGLVAGGLGQFLASPTDLVKVQIQMEGRRRLDNQPSRVRGTWHAFSKIFAEGGIRGLWKGWVPNVQRAALVNLGDLATYDTIKQGILRNSTLKDNYVTHTLASACSGMVAAVMSTPADVVKTRIMNQPTDSNGRGLLYSSSIDCLSKTIRNEGVFALYKGFIPIWTRMAPWSLTFWLTHEEVRKLAGASSF